MNDLKQRFEECLNYVQTADGDFKPSNELKLEMYGLFKQATSGDVSGDKPGMMDFIKLAKYNAWESCKGLTSSDAMLRYIGRVEEFKS